MKQQAMIYSEQTVSITIRSASEPLVRKEGNSMHSLQQQHKHYEEQHHPVTSVGSIRSTTQQQQQQLQRLQRMRATTMRQLLPSQQQQWCLRQRILLPLALLLFTILDENYLGIAISNNFRMMIVTTNAYTTIHRHCGHLLSSSSIQPITSTIPSSQQFPRQPRQQLLPFIIPTQQKLQPLQGYRSMSSSLLSANSNSDSDTINGSDANSSSSKTNDDSKSNDTAAKQRQQLEEDAKKMKVGELKQILESLGISTKTYIEKSEFIKAYIQFKMDGGDGSSNTNVKANTSTTTTKKDASSSSSSSNKRNSSTSSSSQAKDTKDPEYRDVVIYKMNRSDPRMLQGTMIDITIPK